MNYYKVLSLPNNATKKEIRNAYFTLAKKYHPDKNLKDSGISSKAEDNSKDYEKFLLINTAYSTLVNDNLRKIHDINLRTSFPHGLFQDLLNDFNKLTKLIKPVTNFDVITSIRDIYKGHMKEIHYENVLIKYYPIKSMEIEFDNEILKLNSTLIDNLNYSIKDYDLYIPIKLSELPKSICTDGIYEYDLEMPDESIVSISVSEEDVDKIVCYENKGLLKMCLYEIFFDDFNTNLSKKYSTERGDLCLLVKK